MAIRRRATHPPVAARKVSRASGAAALDRIRAMVEKIPAGAVATYGQIAFLAGLPGRARQVGFALKSLPEGSSVPWHRVLNAAGKISSRDDPAWEGFQRHLLEEEGVRFEGEGELGRVDLRRYGWDPEIRPISARRRRK